MHPPTSDLDIAKASIEHMSNATKFPEFEEHWQNFLFRLERTWTVSLAKAKSLGGGLAQSWINENSALRKKDSLLRFLKHARDAETHAVGPTIENVLNLSLTDRLRRPFTIESIEVTLSGDILTFDIKTPDGHIDWQPKIESGDPRLLRFKSRGDWYNPPYEHLGQRIKDLHPVAVAMLGLEFYKNAVDALLVQEARPT